MLQRLLADNPSVLPSTGGTDVPCRWLLVAREAGIAVREGGPSRWSLDHLFLDQDAIPTLVEVKLSRDNRSRREVVAQVLDDAAGAANSWTAGQVQQLHEKWCEGNGQDASPVLADFLDDETDTASFSAKLETNLRSDRMRLIFLGDEIPDELQSIIEFLNRQMRSVDVLAIELRQYSGDGLRTLVPRVIGDTAPARAAKQANLRRSREWDRGSFVQTLTPTATPSTLAAGRPLA